MHPRRDLASLILLLQAVGAAGVARAQGPGGFIAGTVRSAAGDAILDARVSARSAGEGRRSVAGAGPDGTFRLGPLPAGEYLVAAAAPGFATSGERRVTVIAGDTTRVALVLTPRALPAVVVAGTGVAVDPLDPASTRRITADEAAMLPLARDASAAVALVPGAKDGRLWGGAGAVTNGFRVDGAPMNHPGIGGDLLSLPREWVESVEIRGIGAGAEFGEFQGGIVAARLRRGSDERRIDARAFHDAPALSATNLAGDEVGSEPAGRTEVGAEIRGPIVPGRLRYFTGARVVSLARRAPDLRTPSLRDRLNAQGHEREGRLIARLDWSPDAVTGVDLTLGATARDATFVGLDGLDAPEALPGTEAFEAWYHAAWRRAVGVRTTFEARLAGFDGLREDRGTLGADVPSVQPIRRGLEPRWQNAGFSTREAPATHSAALIVRHAIATGPASHALAAGAEYIGTRWRERRSRNGHLTWRPYDSGDPAFDPLDASTWSTVASEWGGELHLGAAAQTHALFVEDAVTVASRVTFTAGARATWSGGWLRPCEAGEGAPRCGGKMRAVATSAIDPRLGVSWDVTGDGGTALKLHAGRFRQGMYARLFDRVQGANAYTDARFHYTAPPIGDSRTSFTPAERDALTGPAGFSPFFDARILSESGVVRGYRQPYVDQLSATLERRLGQRWRLELLLLHRRNGDIVGLVDRNLATNYTVLRDIRVDHRLVSGAILDPEGRPLVLDRLIVSNRDLIDAVQALNADVRDPSTVRRFAGFGPEEVAGLAWDPDIVLAPVKEARRRYDQASLTIAAEHPRWRGEGSLTVARLFGNVAGVTGHGATGTGFSAGPFVRPNEATNALGILPDATEFEAKVWVIATLPAGFRAGALVTHILGERTTPSFTIEGRYRYRDAADTDAPDVLLRDVLGQTILVEPRGSRHYASRSLIDLHLERSLELRGGTMLVLVTDALNVLGSRAITRVQTEIDDQAVEDPKSHLGAPRARVAPRALRLGVRLERAP